MFLAIRWLSVSCLFIKEIVTLSQQTWWVAVDANIAIFVLDVVGVNLFVADFPMYLVLMTCILWIWMNIVQNLRFLPRKLVYAIRGILIITDVSGLLMLPIPVIVYCFPRTILSDTTMVAVFGSIFLLFVLATLLIDILLFVCGILIIISVRRMNRKLEQTNNTTLEKRIKERKLLVIKMSLAVVLYLFVLNFYIIGAILFAARVPRFVHTLFLQVIPEAFTMTITFVVFWPFSFPGNLLIKIIPKSKDANATVIKNVSVVEAIEEDLIVVEDKFEMPPPADSILSLSRRGSTMVEDAGAATQIVAPKKHAMESIDLTNSDQHNVSTEEKLEWNAGSSLSTTDDNELKI